MEGSGSKRYGYYIVDKCPEQVFCNYPGCPFGQVYQSGNLCEVGRYNRNHGSVNGYVTAVSHGDAHIGSGKGSAVVYPVSGHCDYRLVSLETSDLLCLPVRKDIGLGLIYSGL